MKADVSVRETQIKGTKQSPQAEFHGKLQDYCLVQVLQHSIDGTKGQLHRPTPLPRMHRHSESSTRKVDHCPVSQICNASHTCRHPSVAAVLWAIYFR